MPVARVNGIDLFYTDQGEGDPVVLIHGLGSSSADWELQLPALVPSHRVLAVDLRGHGQSSKPAGPYSIAEFADDVATLIEGLGVQACHLVGLSLGGMTALELAATRPDLVMSAVIVNSGPDFIPRTLKDKALVWQRLALVRLAGPEKVAHLVVKRTLPGEQHAELRSRVIESLGNNDKDAYLASMKAIIGWSVRDRLTSISASTLVVASEFDYGSIQSKQPIVDEAQAARMVVVEGARHLLPVEKPDEFNEILSKFLAET
jgi:pimeloyl-ACP methyl ester carboxylesterase